MKNQISKNLTEANKSFDKNKIYSIEEAFELIFKLSYEKFDPSVEVSFNLNLNPKKVTQQLRGSLVLPHGTGKSAKILVIADLEQQEAAKLKGADFIGDETLLEKIQRENWFEFDFIVTTPKYMPKFARYGKLLGPKGLMPNPKLGTVTNQISLAVENIKKGQIEYRTNENGLINVIIGKLSFGKIKLIDNYNILFKLIKSKRPPEVKGEYIKNISIATTMGPGIKIVKD